MATSQHDELVDEALRAHKRVMRRVQALSGACWLQIDLTMAQIKALFLIAEDGPMSVGQAAGRLGIGRPAASALIDGLAHHGLVARHEDAADRRRTIVGLSSSGDELVSTLYRGEQGLLRAWLGRLADEDIAALIRGMRALADAAPDDASPLPAPGARHTA